MRGPADSSCGQATDTVTQRRRARSGDSDGVFWYLYAAALRPGQQLSIRSLSQARASLDLRRGLSGVQCRTKGVNGSSTLSYGHEATGKEGTVIKGIKGVRTVAQA